MIIELLKVKSFYLTLSVPSFKNQDHDRLFGFSSGGGIRKLCTDENFTDCIIVKFNEFKIGLIFISFDFGLMKRINKEEAREWAQI